MTTMRLTTDHLHIAIEWGACLTAMVALLLIRQRRERMVADPPPLQSDGQTTSPVSHQAKTQEALLQEVNHRVKNYFCSIIGLLRMRREFALTREEAGGLRELETKVRALGTVHDLLSRNRGKSIPLHELGRALVENTTKMIDTPPLLSIVTDPPNLTISPSQANSVSLIIQELTSNTVKHASATQPLAISLKIEAREQTIRIVFADNGPGYPVAVLSHAEPVHGMGLDIIRTLVTSGLQGTLHLSNAPGATATIYFSPRTETES